MKIDLSTEDGCSIASAIRGPDFPTASTIKYILTGPIRHWAGVKHFKMVTRDAPLALSDSGFGLIAKEIHLDLGGVNGSHYLRHCMDALHTLGTYGFQTGPLILFVNAIYDEPSDASAIITALRELQEAECDEMFTLLPHTEWKSDTSQSD